MTTLPSTTAFADDVSLDRIWSLASRHRLLLLGLPGAAAVLMLVVSLLLPRSFTARTTFMPQRSELGRAGLASLATQFGVNLARGADVPPPQFYGELLHTHQLLGAVVDTRFQVAGPERRAGTLIELLEASGDTPAKRREDAIRKLNRLVSVDVDETIGLVHVGVTTRWPELSRAIADRMLELLNDFNLKSRRSRATAERQFTSERRADAEAALRRAEAQLLGFLQSNRAWQSSPTLAATHDRLQREVLFRQQTFTQLAQAYEQARIEEVRDTPVFTVIEAPEAPVLPDSRKLVVRIGITLLVSGLAALGLAVLRDARRGRAGAVAAA